MKDYEPIEFIDSLEDTTLPDEALMLFDDLVQSFVERNEDYVDGQFERGRLDRDAIKANLNDPLENHLEWLGAALWFYEHYGPDVTPGIYDVTDSPAWFTSHFVQMVGQMRGYYTLFERSEDRPVEAFVHVREVPFKSTDDARADRLSGSDSE